MARPGPVLSVLCTPSRLLIPPSVALADQCGLALFCGSGVGEYVRSKRFNRALALYEIEEAELGDEVPFMVCRI